MNTILKYGLYACMTCTASWALVSCHDDKDIVLIDQELPLKLAHVYMVGDATPAGWSIDKPSELNRDAENKYLFSYHGPLKKGEFKFPLSKGDWGATFIYAPKAGTVISTSGVEQPEISVRKGGNDDKWRVNEEGIYMLTLDLRRRELQAKYEGPLPVEPIQSKTLGFIGDATPTGWSDVKATMFEKTSDKPLQFTYSGYLRVGEFKLATDATQLKDYAGPYLQAPEAETRISHEGVAKQGFTWGGQDYKWKVTEAGYYKLLFDLTTHRITLVSYAQKQG